MVVRPLGERTRRGPGDLLHHGGDRLGLTRQRGPRVERAVRQRGRPALRDQQAVRPLTRDRPEAQRAADRLADEADLLGLGDRLRFFLRGSRLVSFDR